MHKPTHVSYFETGNPLDLEALFAYQRERYAGFKMEDETPPADEQPPADEKPKEEPKPNEGEKPPADEKPAEGEENKLSHDDALAALKKVRGEAADWRTKYRDIEKKLESAKTPEEVEALLGEVKKTNADDTRALLVENVALKHNLPEELASALKGDTRDELEAHAKVLAKFAPASAEEEPEGSGGLNPGDGDGGFDAVAVAREARKLRHR